MLYTEFVYKVSPFPPPVLVRCWKCGYLHAQEYAGAKWQTQINARVLVLPICTVFLNLGPFSYYLHSYLVSQTILLIAILFFFSFPSWGWRCQGAAFWSVPKKVRKKIVKVLILHGLIYSFLSSTPSECIGVSRHVWYNQGWFHDVTGLASLMQFW